jgi:ATP-binding cassette subfamily C protein
MSRPPGLLAKVAYLLGRRGMYIAAGLLLLTLAGAVLEALSLAVITPFIAVLADRSLIHEQPYLARTYRWTGVDSDREFLLYGATFILAVFVIKNAFVLGVTYLQLRFTYDRLVSLARRLFQAYLASPYLFHLSRNSAELVRNLSTDVIVVFHHVVMPSMLLVSEAVVAALIIGILMAANPVIASTAAGLIAGSAILFYRVFRTQLRDVGRLDHHEHSETIKWVNQGLGSIKEAIILGRQSYALDQFTASTYRHSRALLFHQTINQAPRFFIEMLAVGVLLTVAILLLLQDRTDALLSTLALFALGAFRLMPSLNRIVSIASNLKYHVASVDVVYGDLVRLSHAQAERTAPATPVVFESQIELQSLSFAYPTASAPVLEGLSMTIPKGTTVALVGASGAGKTTVVDLILGLLEPASGRVLVDGVDVRTNLAGWQRNIGYIPQVIYIMDDTIRRNVAFGLPDDRIDEERVWSALRMAQLETLVRRLPEGLDAQAGERGVSLSGGERQRIGIARALYGDPDVLVLDEATSSLDTETESGITQAIDRLSGEKTLIIIAHRLTTVRRADRLYLLRDGKAGLVSYEDVVSKAFGIELDEREIAKPVSR